MKRRSSIDEFLALALEDAMKGIEKDDGGPFGAVVVRERRRHFEGS
jgi:tRNA(Arg) A34 adenosine deaminase TadA